MGKLISTCVDANLPDMDYPQLTVWEKLDAGLIPASRAPKSAIAKSEADAPGYRPESGDQVCIDCGHARGGYCGLYRFFFKRGYTCASWVPDSPTLVIDDIDDPVPEPDDMEEYHARAYEPLTMGPPPEPNRREYPFVGTINFGGLLIFVENEPGSTRSGVDTAGKPWSTRMRYHYGEICGTRGADNDPIDCYVGPATGAPMAYVLHQRLPDAGGYDEDKVMLGFPSLREALAAYAAHAPEYALEPAVTVISVLELRERFARGELEWGPIVKASRAARSKNRRVSGKIRKLIDDGYPQPQAVAIALDMEARGDLAKADRLPGGAADDDDPSDFDSEDLRVGTEHELEHTNDRALAREIAMDHLKEDRDYYRKLSKLEKGRKAEPLGTIKYRADGHYQKINMAPHEWRRVDVNAVRWERAPGVAVGALKPGDVIEVEGRDGLYMLDPAKPKPAKGQTAVDVVSVASGAKERVRTDTVMPLRHAPAAPKKKLPPPPPAARAKAAPVIDEGTEPVHVGEVAKAAKTVKDSRAKPGTVHHKLENGEYTLMRVKDRTGVRFRWAINVPDPDKVVLIQEFQPLLHKIARELASRRPATPIMKFGQLTPEYEEIMSGVKLGMFMALRNYDGGKPFIPWVMGYMKAYGAQGKKSASGSARPWTERDRRLVHTYMAAAYRASAKAAGKTPTDEQIAESWSLTKRMAYGGTSSGLGSYRGPNGEAVNQSDEPVPLEDWQIRTPTGQPKGKKHPGKLTLIKRMQTLMAGDRVGTLLDHDGPADNMAFSPDTPAGLVEHVKGEIESAVDALKEPHRTVIRMLAGIHTDTPGDTGGEAATRDEIAAQLGIGAGQSVQTARRKLRDSGLVEEALTMLQQIAASRGYTAEKWIRRVLPGAAPEAASERQFGQVHTTYGASHNELRDRWGSDAAVGQYYTAMLAGYGAEVAAYLDRAKAGKVTAKEAAVHERRMVILDRERRQRSFYAATRHQTVDPGAARAQGPQDAPAVQSALNDDHLRAAIATAQTKRVEGEPPPPPAVERPVEKPPRPRAAKPKRARKAPPKPRHKMKTEVIPEPPAPRKRKSKPKARSTKPAPTPKKAKPATKPAEAKPATKKRKTAKRK